MDVLIGVIAALAILVGIIVLLVLPYILIGWLIWIFLSPISETLAMALIIGLAIIWALNK